MPSSSTDKRDQRKAELKAEAKALGITYKELKARKKQDNDKKKRKREAERLQAEAEELVKGGEGHRDEMKRMRAYSKDFGEVAAASGGSKDGPDEKRRRTRSMDLAEHGKKEEKIDEKKEGKKAPKTTAEWRKSHNITIRGHGANASKKDFPDPFLQFADAPFGDSIQRSLKAAGFAAPTAIQSQVC